MTFQLTLEQVKNLLGKGNQTVVEENQMNNGQGTVLKLANGCLVNCWNSGKVNCQGKNVGDIERILSKKDLAPRNNKVFVVYGHDESAKVQLEAMLRRWDLEPLILDQLVSAGSTIIEKLEEYTAQADFGIVLATPDDVGYPKEKEDDKKYRVRQNVVLEMGMLLASKGRERVAILLSQAEKMESPSDIHGLIYIPFKNNVEECTVSLAKELKRNGYSIDVSKL